jgi:uncharacterized membrane protein
VPADDRQPSTACASLSSLPIQLETTGETQRSTLTGAGVDSTQTATAAIVGTTLTLMGAVGFVTDPMQGQLLDAFGVNAFHNAFHLGTGLLGIALGFVAAGRYASLYNKLFGLVYLALFAVWFIVSEQMDALLDVGLPDTLLHLGLGVALAGVGYGLDDSTF